MSLRSSIKNVAEKEKEVVVKKNSNLGQQYPMSKLVSNNNTDVV